MKTRNHVLITIALWLLGYSLQGQNAKVTAVDLQSDETLLVGITQDDRGYIWFADIGGGLFRYDGTEIQQYDAKGGTDLGPSSNRSECITTDGKNIWLGTFSSGLNKFDPDTRLFTHYNHDPTDPNSIRSDQIRTLAMDHDGMLWIGTIRGMDKFDPKTETFTHVHTTDPDEDLLREEHIRAMYVDSDGVLWVGSSSPFANEATVGGLFKIEVERNNIEHYQSSDAENTLIDSKVRAIFEDSRGTFWVGTAGDGLHTMDRETGTFTRFQFDPSDPYKLSRSPINAESEFSDHITFINEDDGGNIWIGTYSGGLSMYDPVTDEMSYYAESLPYAHKKIGGSGFWSAHQAKDGVLWIGTWPFSASEEVLYSISTKSKKLDMITLDNNSDIRSYVSDDDGGFYIGGSKGIWYEDKYGNKRTVTTFEDWENSSVQRPGAREMILKSNQLWVSTSFGLYHVNIITNEVTKYVHDPLDPTTLSNNSIISIAQLNDDELLLGAENGLQIFNTKTKKCKDLSIYETNESEPTIETIQDVLIDSKNRIWITLLYKGIRQVDLVSGQLTNYPLSRVGENILYIFEDSNNNIWIGGQLGFYSYNETTQQFERFIDKNGIIKTDRVTYSITEDHQKQLWFSSGNGMAKIDLKTRTTKYYGPSWGFHGGTLTTRGAHTAPNGDVILGDGSGYFRFSPDDLKIDGRTATIPFISDYSINESKVANVNERLKSDKDGRALLGLDHHENNFSFRVNYIDYSTSKEDRVLQYRLEGHDPNWRNIKSGERVLYYNLPSGNYSFQAKALDINGDWQEKVLEISIQPPWWKTWWAYSLYAICTMLLGWVIQKSQRARTIRIEREKTRERELAQAKEIEKAYSELQATQAQLIQSEKMASLGELTAGIAHEIQNPLNFVNNFSDVNLELVDEINEELNEGNVNDIREILADLKSNTEKVVHHGKRADSIVKGMLQHSRSGTGEKVPTDINGLCDEYVRLAYHGLRAKDKSFNADYELNLDDRIGKINVVPQDFSRVILNIITNAFQACVEASRETNVDTTYAPKVTCTTLSEDGRVIITISDNGLGIPDDIKEKIFQPFFTTKPTGQGTGLGLSLAYDIVKAHGGELTVESTEGEGSEFRIELPV